MSQVLWHTLVAALTMEDGYRRGAAGAAAGPRLTAVALALTGARRT